MDVFLFNHSISGFGGLRALQLFRERGLDSRSTIISGTVGTEVAVVALQTVATNNLLKMERPLANMLAHAAVAIIAVDEVLKSSFSRKPRRKRLAI